MALDVTIGSASSDSYVTLAEYKAYSDLMGWDYSELDDGAIEVFIRRAAVYLDGNYRWAGTKATQTQARSWPRDGVTDPDGFEIDDDVIPQAVKNAQCEAAYLYQSGTDPLSTSSSGGGVLKESVKAGAVERSVEYASATTGTDFPAIDNILRGYTGYGDNIVRLARS